MDSSFVPILYVKDKCPYSLKVRLFLLDAGIAERFEVREFTPGDAVEPAIRAELALHFAEVSFEHGIDTAQLPVLRAYADGTSRSCAASPARMRS